MCTYIQLAMVCQWLPLSVSAIMSSHYISLPQTFSVYAAECEVRIRLQVLDLLEDACTGLLQHIQEHDLQDSCCASSIDLSTAHGSSSCLIVVLLM